MTTPTAPWRIAQLLPRFYAKNAQSIGALIPQFTITSFKFGHDPLLIDNSTTPPTLINFDATKNDIENVFHTGTFAASDIVYVDGRLLFRCVIPKNTLTEAHEYSLTSLHDNDGDLVAVCLDLPSWLKPDQALTINPYINFPVTAELAK